MNPQYSTLTLRGSCTLLDKINPAIADEQLLWVGGEIGEVHTYRIPLLTFTTQGSLLAFAEARKLSYKDIGAKFIALRRSTDRGATWSPTSFIVDDGALEDGLNLGSVVVDEETGAVILIYSLCFHRYHCKPSNTMMKRHPPAVGRLVVCGHGSIAGDGVFCILSDDHGNTWRYGAELKSIPYKQHKNNLDFEPDECQPVELDDGSIVINVRNNKNYHCRCRMVVRSLDGGESLPVEELVFDHTLEDPAVAAGALEKEGVLYFTNPASTNSRVNLTLRWSLNRGKSWVKDTLKIWAGPSGYSCMTSLKGNETVNHKYIYVIYEKGQKDSIESVSFVKIDLYSYQSLMG
ncbi:sialidase-1-like [Sinocyclocheilus rhinocerous]|uniref:sialidase-1-like n=1 Tax=Sinocyclocheilus rhinocerous TaxID=307959 RepID=UPI0007B93F60|nr:PREDICTED: sialidase-1-like [Sinocyclocheilus rhinocerous]